MRPARLCVTVTAGTMAELRERRDRVTGADLLELRLDGIDRPSAAGALAGRRLPAIVTCRPAWEGGRFEGTEDEREAILAEALALGAEYVDVEWRAGFGDLIARTGGRRIVVSMHDFNGMPADLGDMVNQMQATGAEVIKVAVTPSRLSDLLTLQRLGARPAPALVLIGMGETGFPSRVLAARFGSCWTYAGDAVAPGQVPQAVLCDELGFRRVTAGTALYGVVGRPVSHSLSPAMHNAAFRAAGIDAVYLPLAAADFDDFLQFAEGIGLAGASVTAPYKVEAFERAVEHDPVSRRVQAVNTLRRVSGGWEGRNTDVEGFLAPLSAATSLAGARATVLGAGGAARGVAVGLASAGARVSIAARRSESAREVARLAEGSACGWPPPAAWDVLVNTTPVGTSPDVGATPLPDGPFGGHLVYDLVYNPPETRLLRDAAAAGCRVIGGLDMLVAQAQAQFTWWTGQRVPARVMRDAALARLGTVTAPEPPESTDTNE